MFVNCIKICKVCLSFVEVKAVRRCGLLKLQIPSVPSYVECKYCILTFIKAEYRIYNGLHTEIKENNLKIIL